MGPNSYFRGDFYLRSCESRPGRSSIGEPNGNPCSTAGLLSPRAARGPGDSGRWTTEDGGTGGAESRKRGKGADDRTTGAAHSYQPMRKPRGRRCGDRCPIDWGSGGTGFMRHGTTLLHLLSAAVPFPVTGGQVSDGKGGSISTAESALGPRTRSTRVERYVRAGERGVVGALDQPEGELAAAGPEMVKGPML